MASVKPVILGGFVMGGIAIGVAAVLIFGGLQLFSRSVDVMVYFPGSVAGLSVGSTVTFRGVRIGVVRSLSIEINAKSLVPVVPVDLSLDPNLVTWTNGVSSDMNAANLPRAIAAGLRAKLNSESLVTGQLNVDLDFDPGTPAVLVGPTGGVMEIPALPSNIQNIEDQIVKSNLPLLVSRVSHLVDSMQQVLDGVTPKLGPLADSAQQAADAARTTLQTATAALRTVQDASVRTLGNIDSLAVAGRQQLAVSGKQLDQLMATTGQAVTQTQRLVTSLADATGPRAPMRTDLEATLRDLAASASSLRTLSRNLERDPAGTLLRRPGP
jgi:paraquat-inducible protein B